MHPKSTFSAPTLVFAATWWCLTGMVLAAPRFAPGDLVRLTRSETLFFKGATFLGAPKGQEFSVLKAEAAQVFVGFVKEEGTLIAVTLPADALELSPPNGWTDLLRGVEAFHAQRFEESKRLLSRAAQDPPTRAIAGGIAARINAVLALGPAGRAASLRSLRETAAQLSKPGVAAGGRRGAPRHRSPERRTSGFPI